MFANALVVNNRKFLLGLDGMARSAMKHFEVTRLLPCASVVASTLKIAPAEVPIEGYYSGDVDLTAYFKLVRALQEVKENRKSEVEGLAEYRRLCEVLASPVFGEAQWRGKLLPVGRDPLSHALIANQYHPEKWTVPILVEAARKVALDSDAVSLVSLAAYIGDAIVLAALRETVALYAEEARALSVRPRPPQYKWVVDQDLADRANRFIKVFNDLTGASLRAAEAANAGHYYRAQEDAEIVGRCVRLGRNETTDPVRYYHWAIRQGRSGKLEVHDFWSEDVWTTERYRSEGDRRYK